MYPKAQDRVVARTAKLLAGFACCLLLSITSASAVTYYVSPTGSDDSSGLSPATAWLNLDNGDQLGILSPGDTVLALPGTYGLSRDLDFNTDANMANRIYYVCTPGTVTLDDANESHKIFKINGAFTVFDGFTCTNTRDHAVEVKAIRVTLRNLTVYNIEKEGIRVEKSDALIYQCVLRSCGEDAILVKDGALRARIHNNTIHNNLKCGIQLGSKNQLARIFNNIITSNDYGIDGNSTNTAGHNNVWDNLSGNYVDGVADSSGGISADPLFNDTANGDFTLADDSPCINAGMDLGYPYAGSAPDMGAFESAVPVSLVITIAIDTMRADSSYSFEAVGIDGEGDTVEVADLAWSQTFATGAVDETGLFRPDLVGDGEVAVESPEFGLTDTTATMTVVAGTVDSLAVSPMTDTVTAGETRQFNASGWDVNGNVTAELGTLTWTVDGSIGTIDNAGLFTATTTGQGFIGVSSDLGPAAKTDTVWVSPGGVVRIGVAPQENILNVLESSQYECYGFDSEGNKVSYLTDSVSWSASRGIITAGGVYTSPLLPGDCYVHADYEGMHDSGHVSVIANLSYIRVENASGDEFGDTTLTTDCDTTVLQARGYTAGDVPIGPVAVEWEVIGADSVGVRTDSLGSSTTLVLTSPGSIMVEAIDASNRRDSSGTITVQPGVPASLVIAPASVTVSTDSTVQFTTTTYDADDNESSGQIVPTWSVEEGIGTIAAGGLFTPTTPGDGLIIAEGLGFADTAEVTVEAGDLARIEVTPDSTSVSADSTVQFTVVGYDAADNETAAGTITWSVVGGIGTIDATGLFIATTTGTGQIAAESSIGGLTDTTTELTVTPGTLVRMEVSPDVADVRVGDSIQFVATGYDAEDNITPVGFIAWDLLGRVGTLDLDGLFVAEAPGSGQVTAASSLAAVEDTSGLIDVEELLVTAIPLGTQTAVSNQADVPVIGLRIQNYFDTPRELTGVRVRDVSRGAGTAGQIRANAASLSLYLDANNDSLLTIDDSLLAQTLFIGETPTLNLGALTLDPRDAVNLLVALTVDADPRDGDTLDVYLRVGDDLTFADATVASGPDSLNSLGAVVINGMVAGQLSASLSAVATIEPADSAYHLLTVDIPRNGYETDNLGALSLENTGTATAADIDAFVLYQDDGNDVWTGEDDETALGEFVFTGSQWTLSGLSAVLNDAANRFYVGARLVRFPTNGATISLQLPVNAVSVSSGNDGPIDSPVAPGGTATIQTSESVAIRAVDLPSQTLIPGEVSPPVLALEFSNTYASPAALDSLNLTLDFEAPNGGTQAQLLSQVDSVLIYVSRDGDVSQTTDTDTLLAAVTISNSTDIMAVIGGYT
ncbi:hypothetical protein GF377_05595, partial [candidate division GN15 bacterium]|nr:hypothetical protein [candidate division GN15 bacterium]